MFQVRATSWRVESVSVMVDVLLSIKLLIVVTRCSNFLIRRREHMSRLRFRAMDSRSTWTECWELTRPFTQRDIYPDANIHGMGRYLNMTGHRAITRLSYLVRVHQFKQPSQCNCEFDVGKWVLARWVFNNHISLLPHCVLYIYKDFFPTSLLPNSYIIKAKWQLANSNFCSKPPDPWRLPQLVTRLRCARQASLR